MIGSIQETSSLFSEDPASLSFLGQLRSRFIEDNELEYDVNGIVSYNLNLVDVTSVQKKGGTWYDLTSIAEIKLAATGSSSERWKVAGFSKDRLSLEKGKPAVIVKSFLVQEWANTRYLNLEFGVTKKGLRFSRMWISGNQVVTP